MTVFTRSTLGALLLLTAGGCASAGRTAAWEKAAPPPAEAQPTTGGEAAVENPAMAEAQALWEQRDDKAKLLSAIARWEAVVKQEPGNADALVALSRAYYFLVDGFLNIEAPQDIEEVRLEYHTKGADMGERALLAVDPAFDKTMRAGGDFIEAIGKIDKPAVPAAYWYCTNLGRFAVAKGLSAKLFYKDRIASAMQRIKAIAPDFFYAAADRYLGAFYAALPGIAGKDLDKSAVHFKSANEGSPQYLGNKVVQAEFLAVELDDQAMYESLLNEVLKGADGDDPNVAPENRAAKRSAKMLLTAEAIDDRF